MPSDNYRRVKEELHALIRKERLRLGEKPKFIEVDQSLIDEYMHEAEQRNCPSAICTCVFSTKVKFKGVELRHKGE